MPAPPPRRPHIEAAQALAAVAPLATRWIERLLAAHEPPLTVAQYLVLRAIAGGQARPRLGGGAAAGPSRLAPRRPSPAGSRRPLPPAPARRGNPRRGPAAATTTPAPAAEAAQVLARPTVSPTRLGP